MEEVEGNGALSLHPKKLVTNLKRTLPPDHRLAPPLADSTLRTPPSLALGRRRTLGGERLSGLSYLDPASGEGFAAQAWGV
jgi:hypothetical protein